MCEFFRNHNGLPREWSIEIEVAEAVPDGPIRSGRAVIVPIDIDGLVRQTDISYRVELVEGPTASRHRPCVEVLFRSADRDRPASSS